MEKTGQALLRKLMTLAVAGLGLAVPAPASADFLDFTVDESTVAGAVPLIFVADKINGSYTERITFDAGGNFDTNVYADWGQYLALEGSVGVPNQLGQVGTPFANQYGLYTLFSGSGTAVAGPGGSTIFTGASASIEYWIDPNADTTKAVGATGASPIILGNTADDYMILFANDLISAVGVLMPPTGGFFDFVFGDPTKTAAGALYWPDLPTLGFQLILDGDFDNFEVSGTQTVTGDVSTVFQTVPEPATLALFALGLLGTGAMARRRRLQA